MKLALLSCSLCVFCVGCTLRTTSVPIPVAVLGTALNGVVHGGSQPIAQAKVYLLSPNNVGISSSLSGSLSLLTQSQTGNAPDAIGSYVLTGSDGSFSISADYSCTSGVPVSGGAAVTLPGNEQLYLYVSGGNPGGPNSPANTSIALMATLGPCNSPLAHVSVNEVTTVATAYALAGWAYDPLHMSAPSVGLGNRSVVALADINNAFANASLLANMSAGTANSSLYSGEGLAPAATVNTIANIIASCVNGATGNANCNTLFQYTSSISHYNPTNTAQVPMLLAQSPNAQSLFVTTLFNLQPGVGAPYPGLSTAPQNFMLPLEFAIGDVNSKANAIAIDSAGNAWIANQTAVLGLSSSGQNLAGAHSKGFDPNAIFSNAQSLAINQQGQIWVTDATANAMFELSSSGSLLSTVTSVPTPNPIAVGANGNLWVGDTQDAAVYQLSSSGAPSNMYSLGSFGAAQKLAIDSSANVWAIPVSDSIGQIAELTFPSGIETTVQHTGFTRPAGIVFDIPSFITWVSDSAANQLVGIPNNTASSIHTGFNGPTAIAVDGVGHVWTLNTGNSSLGFFGSILGFSNPLLKNPFSLAIDGSGSLWVVQPASVLEFIGSATPLVTPVTTILNVSGSQP
jgi:streptogramin lyase